VGVSQEALAAAFRPRAATVGLAQPDDFRSRVNDGDRAVDMSRRPSASPSFNDPGSLAFSVCEPSRSLRLSNIGIHVTAHDLVQFFQHYGAIECVRIADQVRFCHHRRALASVEASLAQQSARVYFYDVGSACSAHADVSVRQGQIWVDQAPVKIDFEPPDLLAAQPAAATNVPTGDVQVPTRALWFGSIPESATASDLLKLATQFGPVESARALSTRGIGFCNFERVDDAVRARIALNGRPIFGDTFGAVRGAR
jgi:protein JSN1